MDYQRIQSTLQKTMGALKKAEESGDVEEMDRLSSYMDRMRPVMERAKAEIDSKQQPPMAPSAPNAMMPPKTPPRAGNMPMGADTATPPPPQAAASETLPSQGLPAWAQTPFELQMPSGEMNPGKMDGEMNLPVSAPPAAPYKSPPGLASSFPGGAKVGGPVSDQAVQGGNPFEFPFKPIAIGQMAKPDRKPANAPNHAPPMPDPDPSVKPGAAPQLGEGEMVNKMLNAAAMSVKDKEEADELEAIKAEIGEKPDGLTLENLAIMLLMGAPRAFSKIMAEQSEWRTAFRNAKVGRRKEKAGKERQGKEDSWREREVKVKEDSAKNLKDYRDQSMAHKVSAEDEKSARVIMANQAMNDPKDVEWARMVMQHVNLQVPGNDKVKE